MVPAQHWPMSKRKIVAAQKLGLDALGLTSILGATQRLVEIDHASSTATTWKLWGNEVSLLRMA